MNTSRTNSRRLLNWSFAVFIGILAAAGALAYYAFLVEPDRLVVKNYQIEIPESGPALNGLKIVAISDLHGGSAFIDENKLKLVAETVNAQQPDVVFILGDFVSQESSSDHISLRPLKMAMSTIADSIRSIKAKHGVYAVIGNHDEWYDREVVSDELERVGIRVLYDEMVSIDRNGSKLYVLGLRDILKIGNTMRFRREVAEIVGDIPEGDLIILDHGPDVMPILTGEGSVSDKTRLFFAGHTHGGQVWLPIVGRMVVPSMYDQKFAAGPVKYEDSTIFVTTGIGTSIMPVRFMVPPEISVVTVTK